MARIKADKPVRLFGFGLGSAPQGRHDEEDQLYSLKNIKSKALCFEEAMMELVIGYASSVLMCSGKGLNMGLTKVYRTQHPSYFPSLTSVPSTQIQSGLKF